MITEVLAWLRVLGDLCGQPFTELKSDLNDGLLDVVLTDRAARWEIVKELPRIQRGAYLQHPKVSLMRARTVEVTSETPIAVDIDGEFAGYTPARLTVVPSAVRFIVPALADSASIISV